MVPTQDFLSRGRSPARANDVLEDDSWTVYSDTESVSSCSTDLSYHFFPIRARQDHAPALRLKKGEQDRSVYEAWNIHHFPARREPVEGFKVLGVKLENYEEVPGRVDVRPQPSTQGELLDMHLQAIDGFRAKHKRHWATRVLCGRGKTYEQHLEERCRGLSEDVRRAVSQLLIDRGKATSTHYRTRTWTVVVMRQQLRHRFTEADFTEVKRHKLRFWKNPKPEEHMLYTVVIRGAETKAYVGESAPNTFAPLSNPWVQPDSIERRHKLREERQQRNARRNKRHTLSPSFRTRSRSYRAPSPSFRARPRSGSPPSYRSCRTRSDSLGPSIRSPRFESPPPYRRYTRGGSPIRSRSPSVRIRVVPRYNSHLDDAPFPPTPPESFTPPPGVSAYHVPGPIPAPYTSPFQPRPAFPPAAPFPVPPHCIPSRWPTTTHSGSPTLTQNPTPLNCLSCRNTRPCGHYSHLMPCYRPVARYMNTTYHPPCLLCAAYDDPPPPPPPPRAACAGIPGAWAPSAFRPNYPSVAMGPGPPIDANQFGPAPPRFVVPPPPPPPPPSSRPPSWFNQPPPPPPNPFSPLSTPPLTSAGGSVAGRSESSLGEGSVRTPSEVGDVGEDVVEMGSERGRVTVVEDVDE